MSRTVLRRGYMTLRDGNAYGTTWQSYWAADWYVCDRVRGFLQRRHKVPSRGTRRFSDQYIYGHLGVVSLRALRKSTA